MSVQDPRGFNDWLRAQLKAKRMSQRQLAQQAGVDHSTISRLVRGDRTPSLGTATKLARGLREIREDSDSPAYFGQVGATTTNPTARVEYALRSDDELSEGQVRQIMDLYLTLRTRRPVAIGTAAARRNGEGSPILLHPVAPSSGVATAGLSARRFPART